MKLFVDEDTWYQVTLKKARRAVILVVGGTVVLFGISLIVLPGPAFIVIPLGLVILATEFIWARRLLRRVKSGLLETKKSGFTAIKGWFRKR